MEENPSIELVKMQEFEEMWRNDKFPHQRYGQAFCNHFNIESSYIFYSEDYRTIRTTVWLEFVIFPDEMMNDSESK